MVNRRSGFRASDQGLLIIKTARSKKGWSWAADINDEPLIIASRYIEPDKTYPIETPQGKIYADNVNESSWRRFLGGKQAIPIKVFIAYCQALEISWELVVDWNCLNGQLPLTFVQGINICTEKLNQDASQFIRDVTIPDGSIMQPGEEFTKIWEIRNAGNVFWSNRYLKRLGSCRGHGLISSPERIKIPDTAPGEIIQIVVTLEAPAVATTTTAAWKMINSNGTLCFPDRYEYGLFVTIQVVQ